MMNYMVVPGLIVETKIPSMERIVAATAYAFRIDESRIYLRTRKREVSIARQMAMYVMRKKIPMISVVVIAKHFNMDHTTVVHGTKLIKNMLTVDEEIQAIYQKIIISLNMK